MIPLALCCLAYLNAQQAVTALTNSITIDIPKSIYTPKSEDNDCTGAQNHKPFSQAAFGISERAQIGIINNLGEASNTTLCK